MADKLVASSELEKVDHLVDVMVDNLVEVMASLMAQL